MINARTFLGHPTNFLNQCWIYPPLIKDIVDNEKFGVYQHILTIDQAELDDSMNECPIDDTPRFTVSLELDANGIPKPAKPRVQAPTPFEYLLINSYNDKNFQQIAKQAFYFFIRKDITFLWDVKAIFLGSEADFKAADYTDIAQIPLLTEENYPMFQNMVRVCLGMPQTEAVDRNEDPRIARMKAKARYRDQIKAKSNSNLNLESMLAAICCSNLGITPLTIGEISYGAVKALFEMYQNKEKYELDISSLLAGADPHKVQPKHWITNLND